MRELPRPQTTGSPLGSGPTSVERSALALLACVALSLCWSCHADPAPVTPKQAVDAYARAVRDKRYDDAYALLSRDARKLVTRQDFEERLEHDPQETSVLLAGLGASSNEATVRATITGRNGETLDLVYEGDAWRVEERAVDLYGQRTPRAALSSFVRAFDAKRWDVLLRFVPAGDQDGMDEKVLAGAWQGEQKPRWRPSWRDCALRCRTLPSKNSLATRA